MIKTVCQSLTYPASSRRFSGLAAAPADGAQERGPRHDDVLVHPERVDLAPAGRRPRVEHRRPAGDEPLGVEELPVEYAPSPVLEHELAVADAVPRRDALEVAAVPQAERHDLQDGRARAQVEGIVEARPVDADKERRRAERRDLLVERHVLQRQEPHVVARVEESVPQFALVEQEPLPPPRNEADAHARGRRLRAQAEPVNDHVDRVAVGHGPRRRRDLARVAPRVDLRSHASVARREK